LCNRPRTGAKGAVAGKPLQEEIEFIHYANELYWRDANPGDAAKADYYRRQDRLEEIRSELADLRKHN